MLITWSIVYGFAAGVILVLLIKNSTSAKSVFDQPRAVNCTCLALFMAANIGVFYMNNVDIKNKKFLRQSGVETTATIIGHHVEYYRRYHENYIDFSYQFPKHSRKYFHNTQLIHDQTYHRFGVGTQIPIRVDPRDPSNSRTSVSAPPSSDDYAVQLAFDLIVGFLGTVVVVGLFWLLLVFVAGVIKEKRTDQSESIKAAWERHQLLEPEPVVRFDSSAQEASAASPWPDMRYRPSPPRVQISPEHEEDGPSN